MSVIDLHPPLGAAKALERDGETYINIPGIIRIAREGDTPQCRALMRFYSAEWRSLEGRSLTAQCREADAFRAAWARMVRKFGVTPLAGG